MTQISDNNSEETCYEITIRNNYKSGMSFNYNDGGRTNSKRPRQSNDCTVRAGAIAFGMDYDTVYDTMSVNGRKSGQGMLRKDYERVYKDFAKESGKSFNKLSFPAEKGLPRMNTQRFIEQFGKGVFILRQAKHVVTVIDGVVNDTFETWDRCVYLAWEVK